MRESMKLIRRFVHLTKCAQGHGTLNAIYAAIDKACEARDWGGVDLLIIGGDFQVSEKSLGIY